MTATPPETERDAILVTTAAWPVAEKPETAVRLGG